jgi:Domain of unknown function (DUF6795)
MIKNKFLVLISLLVISNVGVSMSVFSAEEVEVVLFSPMEGMLTVDGEPAEGARLERMIKWEGGEQLDTFDVLKDGLFSFDIFKKELLLNPLNQLVIKQKIYAVYNGQRYKIWSVGKMDIDEYGEIGSKPSNFKCELTDELVHIEANSPLFVTSCKWDNVE